MNEKPAASVIIATYNDASILEWSLAAFARQDLGDFELLLADDGSSEDYAPVLRRWSPCFRRALAHVRHERGGFRKTRIQNRAVSLARSENLVFVDIDCLPREDFLRRHLEFLRPGVALTGRRVNIKREILPPAREIYERGLRLGPVALVAHWLRGNAKVIEHGVELPFFYETRGAGILGCNFSVKSADFAAVNGFSEEFEGRGGEDTDIEFRLRRNGVRVRCLRNKLIEYHLMHPVRVGSFDSDFKRIEEKKATGEIRARRGLAEIQPGDFNVIRYEPAAP